MKCSLTEKGSRNQQHAIKHIKQALQPPTKPTMGLGEFEPNKQTVSNFFKALLWTQVLLNSKTHQQG